MSDFLVFDILLKIRLFVLGALKSTSCYSRYLELYSNLLKMIWFFYNSERIEKIFKQLRMNNKHFHMYGLFPTHRLTKTFLGLLTSLFVAVIVEILDFNSTKLCYMYTWIFTLTKDIIEFHFMEVILSNIRHKLYLMNVEFLTLSKSFNPSLYMPKLLVSIKNEEQISKIMKMQKISLECFNFSQLNTYISKEIAYAMVITMIVKIGQVINCAYSIILIVLMDDTYGYLRSIIWMHFVLLNTILLIKLWDDVQEEVSLTNY